MRALPLLVLIPFLAACGQKGDLYLPDPSPSPPAPRSEPPAPNSSGESLQDLDTIPSDRIDPLAPENLGD